MKKLISIFLSVLALAVSAAVWLNAKNSAPKAEPGAPAPTIGATAANPTVIAVNTPAAVTLTSVITDPSVIPTGVNLLRLNANGTSTVLGQLRDDGTSGDAIAGDKTFTLVKSFNETMTGEIKLQVSAAFRGQLRRTASGVIVLQAAESESFPSLGITLLHPQGWIITMRDTPEEDDPTPSIVSARSPNGSSFLILPAGGEGYGLDDEFVESVTETVVSGFSAKRRDDRLPDGTLILVRFELGGVPNFPDYRIEYRIKEITDLPILDSLLKSLLIQP